MKRPKGLRHLLLFMGIQKKGNSDCEILRRIDIGKLKRKERFGALLTIPSRRSDLARARSGF